MDMYLSCVTLAIEKLAVYVQLQLYCLSTTSSKHVQVAGTSDFLGQPDLFGLECPDNSVTIPEAGFHLAV